MRIHRGDAEIAEISAEKTKNELNELKVRGRTRASPGDAQRERREHSARELFADL
jgi:hypothetical protein